MFSLYCTGKDCADQQAFVGVGHLEFSGGATVDPSGPALRQGFVMLGSMLFVRPGHGAAAMQYEYDADMDFSTGVAAAGHGPDPATTVQGDVVGRPSGLPLPSPAEAAGAGALALLAGALYWLWPALKGGAFLGLFSRLRPSRLLEHPQRARIADLVAADPGVHFQELGRRSGIPNGTLVHHLSKLVAGDLVVAHRSGRYTCYFPKQVSPSVRSNAGLTKSGGAKAILAAIQARPGLTMQDVAMQCGLQASTVTYHVHRLAEAGMVDVNRDGRFQRLQARAAA